MIINFSLSLFLSVEVGTGKVLFSFSVSSVVITSVN